MELQNEEPLTVNQVAAILGVSAETVRNRTTNRVKRKLKTLIEYEEHGRIIRFTRAAVEKYREAMRRLPAAVPDSPTRPDAGDEEAE